MEEVKTKVILIVTASEWSHVYYEAYKKAMQFRATLPALTVNIPSMKCDNDQFEKTRIDRDACAECVHQVAFFDSRAQSTWYIPRNAKYIWQTNRKKVL